MAKFRVSKIIEFVTDESGDIIKENLIGYALFMGEIYIDAFGTMAEVESRIGKILDYEMQENMLDYDTLKEGLESDQCYQEKLTRLENLHYSFHYVPSESSSMDMS